MTNREQHTDCSGSLRLLAAAQPPAGMDERILRRIREAELAAAAPAPRRWQPSLIAAFATCIAAVAVFTPLWHSHLLHPKASSERNNAMGSSAAWLSGETQTAVHFPSDQPLRTQSHVARQNTQGSSQPHTPWDEQRHQPRHQPRQELRAAVRSQLASFPAPPAPLTREERLLVRLSQPGAPARAVAEQVLFDREPAEVPGTPLPALRVEHPGHALPTLAGKVPGEPLPNFFEAMKTGDQP